jgi:hypothetical protein
LVAVSIKLQNKAGSHAQGRTMLDKRILAVLFLLMLPIAAPAIDPIMDAIGSCPTHSQTK